MWVIFDRRLDWDRDDCWFAHCCNLTDEDLQNFHDFGAGVAHCPCSNMRLASGKLNLLAQCLSTALGIQNPIKILQEFNKIGSSQLLPSSVKFYSFIAVKEVFIWEKPGILGDIYCYAGIARVQDMLKAKVNVGLGTDGSSSNESSNLLHEARMAMFLQRSKGDPKGTGYCGCTSRHHSYLERYFIINPFEAFPCIIAFLVKLLVLNSNMISLRTSLLTAFEMLRQVFKWAVFEEAWTTTRCRGETHGGPISSEHAL